MVSSNAYGERLSSLDFWGNNRQTIDDLYESERYYLEPILKKVTSVLDVGCAAGGFYKIAKEINPHVNYSGIDISPELINIAKKRFPEIHFSSYDGNYLPFKSNTYDLVFSFGLMHHLSHWANIIHQMATISARYIIFDIRLTKNESLNDPDKYFQKIAYNETWDGVTKIAYIVLNFQDFYKCIEPYTTGTHHCSIFGYEHPPTNLAVIPYNSVYTCSVFIDKKSAKYGLDKMIRW